jgi:hypothetical protein
VEGSCEHSKEPSGSIKYWESLVWLSNFGILKKDSGTQRHLVIIIIIPTSQEGLKSISLTIKIIIIIIIAVAIVYSLPC